MNLAYRRAVAIIDGGPAPHPTLAPKLSRVRNATGGDAVQTTVISPIARSVNT